MSSINLKSILTYGAAYWVANDLFNGRLDVNITAGGAQDGATFSKEDFKNYLKGTYNGVDPGPALVQPNVNGSNDTHAGDTYPWAMIIKGSTLRNPANYNKVEMTAFKQWLVDNPQEQALFQKDIFKDAGSKNVNLFNDTTYNVLPQVVMLNNQGTDKTYDWLNTTKNNGPQMFFWNWAQSGLGAINTNSVTSDPDANLIKVINSSNVTTALDTWEFTFIPAGDSQFPPESYQKTSTFTEEVYSSTEDTTTIETGGSKTASISLRIGAEDEFWGGSAAYEQSWSWNKSISSSSVSSYTNGKANSVNVTFNPGAIPKSEDGQYHWSGNQQNITPVKDLDPSLISSDPAEPAILTPGGKYIYRVEYDRSSFTSGFQHLQKISGSTSGHIFVGTFYDWRAGTKDDAINYRPGGGNPLVGQLLDKFKAGGGFETYGISEDNPVYAPDGKGGYKPVLDAYGNQIKTAPIYSNQDGSITAVDTITLDSELGTNIRTRIVINGNAYKSENSNKTTIELDELRGGLDPNLGVAYIASDNEIVIDGRGRDVITLKNNSSAVLGKGDTIEITGSGNSVTTSTVDNLLTASAFEGASADKGYINFSTSNGSIGNSVVLASSTVMDLGWGGVRTVIKSSNNIIDSTHGNVSDPSAANTFSFQDGSTGNVINNFLLGYDRIEFGADKIKSAIYDPVTQTAELIFGDKTLEINIDFRHSGFNPDDPIEILSTYLLTKLYYQGGLIKDGKTTDVINFKSAFQQLEDYGNPTTGTNQLLAKYILSPELLSAGQNLITPHKFLTWVSIQAIQTGKSLSDLISDTLYSILPNSSSNGQSVDVSGIKNYITSHLSSIITSDAFKNGYAKISDALSGLDFAKIANDTQYFNKIYYSAIVPAVESLSSDQLKALDQGVDNIITGVVNLLAFATDGPGANSSYNRPTVNLAENEWISDTAATGSYYVGTDGNTIVYAGPREQFSIQNFAGYINISSSPYASNLNSPGAIDVIKNFDRVKFDDSSIAYDLGKAPGEIYNLYNALLARAPDLDGIGYWIKEADRGASMTTIAQSFFAGNEFQSLKAKSNSEYVDMLYIQGLERTADTAGRAYWIELLDKGALSRADVASAFASSEEGIGHAINKIGSIGLIYNNYLGN